MIELKNITFDEYLCLEDRSEYDWAIDYAYIFEESKDIFNVGEFTKLKFGLIKDFQYDLGQNMAWDKMVEYMIKLTGQNIKTFCNLPLLSIVQFKNYIIEQMKYISDMERKMLGYEPTDEEISAGIDNFAMFGIYGQLLSVAQNNPLNIEQVRNLTYEDAFVYLCYKKTESEYQIRLNEIRSKKMD